MALWLDWMMLALWLEQRLYNATGSDDIMVGINVDSGRDKRYCSWDNCDIVVETEMEFWLECGIMVGTVLVFRLDSDGTVLWLEQRWYYDSTKVVLWLDSAGIMVETVVVLTLFQLGS